MNDNLTVGKIIDNAYMICGASTPYENPEAVLRAKESLHFAFTDLISRGTPSFMIKPKLIGLEPNKWKYDLDRNDYDIWEVNWRQCNHSTTINTIPNEPNPEFLSDYEWDTYATITSTATLLYEQSSENVTDYYGILPYENTTASFAIYRIIDINTTELIAEYIDYDLTKNKWLWVDMVTPVNCIGIKIQNLSSTPLKLKGFYVGTVQRAYELTALKMNRDDFFSYPNKGIVGIPINYFFLKDTIPQLQWWQSAIGANVFKWVMSTYTVKLPELDLKLPLPLDIPKWYIEGITWVLASKLVFYIPNLPEGRLLMVQQQAQKILTEMELNNGDTANINVVGNMLAAYTGRGRGNTR